MSRQYGVRWQARRDTALDAARTSFCKTNSSNPKRRRRAALPAHSKISVPGHMGTAVRLVFAGDCRALMREEFSLFDLFDSGLVAQAVFESGANERGKKRMGIERPGFVFRMKLAS